MVACENVWCRKELQESWCFCPYCGQDCRPPAERRVAIRVCDHEFFGELPYCLRCGFNLVSGQFVERGGDIIKRRTAKGFVILGFSLFALSLFFTWLIEGAYGPAQVLIDQQEAGKSLSEPVAKKRGTSVLSPILAVAGFVSLGVGGYLWHVSKARPLDD